MLETIPFVLLGYFTVGLLFGVHFAFGGAARIDPVATEATWGFRVLVIPGAAALWPLLLPRVVRGQQGAGG